MFPWQEQYHSFTALTREILFLPLEHKIHIFSPPCSIVYVLAAGWLEIYIFFQRVVSPSPGPSFFRLDTTFGSWDWGISKDFAS